VFHGSTPLVLRPWRKLMKTNTSLMPICRQKLNAGASDWSVAVPEECSSDGKCPVADRSFGPKRSQFTPLVKTMVNAHKKISFGSRKKLLDFGSNPDHVTLGLRLRLGGAGAPPYFACYPTIRRPTLRSYRPTCVWAAALRPE